VSIDEPTRNTPALYGDVAAMYAELFPDAT